MPGDIQLSTLLWNLGRWAGIAGFTCLSLLIFSGDTARFFDRYFGLDKIIKFQRKFSLISAIFILLHPIFFMLSSESVTDYIIPDFTVIPFALGVVAFYIFTVIMIASKLYKKISYALWQYLHVLTYALFFLGLYHAANWGSTGNLIYIKILYISLLFVVVVGSIYRTYYKIKKRYAGKFYLKEIKQETKDTFTLIIRPEKKFKFKAGQFCFLRINKNKLHTRHPFTISSSPGDRNLHFTIKKAGKFTRTVSKLKPGEEVIIDGPFGNFIEKDEKKDLVFIAGGVGITPFMSLTRDHIEENKTRNICLLYSSKTREDIIFKNILDNIRENWFKMTYILSKGKSSLPLSEQGRINKIIIAKHVKNIKNSLFYICGPATMKNHVKKILLDSGVSKQNIIIESFFW